MIHHAGEVRIGGHELSDCLLTAVTPASTDLKRQGLPLRSLDNAVEYVCTASGLPHTILIGALGIRSASFTQRSG